MCAVGERSSKIDQLIGLLEKQNESMSEIMNILMGMSAVMHINDRNEDAHPLDIGDLHKRLAAMERHVKSLQTQVTYTQTNNIHRSNI